MKVKLTGMIFRNGKRFRVGEIIEIKKEEMNELCMEEVKAETKKKEVKKADKKEEVIDRDVL